MTIFTLIHVGISLVAILSGFVVLKGMLTAKQLDVLVAFIVLGILAAIRFRAEPVFASAPNEQEMSTKQTST